MRAYSVLLRVFCRAALLVRSLRLANMKQYIAKCEGKADSLVQPALVLF